MAPGCHAKVDRKGCQAARPPGQEPRRDAAQQRLPTIVHRTSLTGPTLSFGPWTGAAQLGRIRLLPALTLDQARLTEEIVELGPWHLDVEVAPGLSTRAWVDAGGEARCEPGNSHFESPGNGFKDLLSEVYPGGLDGRAVLDCACNCGGYLFWSRECGAGRCFGFDVREHWIRQARFLRDHRTGADDVEFEVLDLYDLPRLALEPFDMTVFKGIFYHLPEPIGGLRIAAELTRELLFLDTATCNDRPDGGMVADFEDTEMLMSGVHGLAWRPTGPEVLEGILGFLGFAETQVLTSIPETHPGHGRITMLASRTPGLLGPIGERIAAAAENG